MEKPEILIFIHELCWEYPFLNFLFTEMVLFITLVVIVAFLYLLEKYAVQDETDDLLASTKSVQCGEYYFTKKANKLYEMLTIILSVCAVCCVLLINTAQTCSGSLTAKGIIPHFISSPSYKFCKENRLRMSDFGEVLRFMVRSPKHFGSTRDTDFDSLFHLNKRLIYNEFSSATRQKVWVCPSSQSLVKLFGAIDNNQRGSSLMNFEWARYETFKTFPMESPAMPSRLAANGFFYTEESDTVMCFSCNLKYGGWKSGDDPSEIHIRLSPQCLFINKSDSSNIPIHESNETTMQVAAGGTMQGAEGGSSFDTDGRHVSGGLRIQQQNRQDQGRMTTRTSQYKHPEYANITARRSSFLGWPSEQVVTVEELVKAGFFYAGFGDCVRCFSCGGGLKNWQYGDTPMEEHRTWFPTCVFLLELGSLEFHSPRLETLTEENAACHTSTTENSFPASAQSAKVNEAVAGAENTVSEDARASIIEPLHSMGFDMQAIQTCISSVWKKYGSVSLDAVLEDLLETNDSEQLEMQNKEDEHLSLPTNDSKTSEKQKKEDEVSEPSQIDEENSALKSQILCKICMDKTSNVVFRPCGHMVSCENCSQRLRKCAVCRQLIEGRITVFNGA